QVAPVGRAEYVGRGRLLDLGGQGLASGEVEGHLGPAVGGGELLPDLGEGGGQRRRREHLDLARGRGPRASARVVVATTAGGERQRRHRQLRGQAGPG